MRFERTAYQEGDIDGVPPPELLANVEKISSPREKAPAFMEATLHSEYTIFEEFAHMRFPWRRPPTISKRPETVAVVSTQTSMQAPSRRAATN
jgi:hypothetical protein